jgi:hypothetical protein
LPKFLCISLQNFKNICGELWIAERQWIAMEGNHREAEQIGTHKDGWVQLRG